MQTFIHAFQAKRNADLATPSSGTSRRSFIKLMTTAGASLTLGVHLPAFAASAADTTGEKFKPNAFIRISEDNTVTILIKHLEMGQGVTTGLATIAADELDADWALVSTEAAPANANLYNNLLFGPVQGTGGSTAIANSFMQLRVAGAKARTMLVSAAAKLWKVPASDISVSKNVVSHQASGKSASFGELAELAAMEAVPADDAVTLKKPDQFSLIGKTGTTRKDHGKSNGTATFTQDVQIEGMLTAVVAHPPSFGAKLISVDATGAKKSPGVVDVVQIPTGVAVVAKDFWSAKVGRDKLKLEWDRSAFTKSTDDLIKEYKTLADQKGLPARVEGDASGKLATADKVLEATYYFPFLAHAAMEPMNCVVLAEDDKCEMWYSAQLPTIDQFVAASILNIKTENIAINTVFAGGSFGRRANPQSDYVAETVMIANTQRGVPIKLVWTREDDMHAGYYRPMYVQKIRASLDDQGNVDAWEQRIVGQSIAAGTSFEDFMVKDGIDNSSVEGSSTLPYRIPHFAVELHTTKSPVPVLWWRSVGHTHNAFSTETFIDQLAHVAGKDPVAYRLNMLEGHPRLKGVLKLAAEKAGWDKPLPEGSARGIALHESFRTFVAQVAEVSVKNGEIVVERVVCAVDCGVAINPSNIEAQMQGGIGFGLSQTLESEITLKDGAVVQSNFHDYKVLRFAQMPTIDVHIVPSAEPPTGVGEPGTPPIAPAVANAVFALTGQRLTDLPLRLAKS
ncbi:xanthine dehydrogenase family protein molybdopterin-binding subunit [Enterovibrio norvegicus]|uniref:xanthine dehydrogenase family protein molybdopterin-binding subunit n=1 Tax=Enterovibrio norvegicus TaxID=188144 RepID=UPI000C861432|nr:xanthine dehydrogenase family protein molybdopterin-binding subunit [Enterovibrio norvegicus]PMI34692.1 twin-arginine translocation pathway signal protein [Enterovibrio norvegicus]TKF17642.1 xanthine dehydrogenase family protein molybdopterin-binding subunit [Enterovibrio norvegicus]